MITREQNELLCRVEGAAPMGQLMRRHWLPVCMSEEVAERDGAPVRARLLGEDLVVFRDIEGPPRRARRALPAPRRVALLRPQRGVRPALPLSRLEVRRRRQRARHVLGAPGSAMLKAVKQKAYPGARRRAASSGSGWADKARMREFEPPAWAPAPDIKYAIVKMHAACNWAQVLEGSIDSAHSSSLHSTNMPAAEVRRRQGDHDAAGRDLRTTRRRGCSSS